MVQNRLEILKKLLTEEEKGNYYLFTWYFSPSGCILQDLIKTETTLKSLICWGKKLSSANIR